MRVPLDMSVEEAVLDRLQSSGPSYLEDLVMQLPNFSWSQVFLAVDRMSQEGLLSLQHLPSSAYYVALPSRPALRHSSRHEEVQL
jgi:hypothetical protein